MESLSLPGERRASEGLDAAVAAAADLRAAGLAVDFFATGFFGDAFFDATGATRELRFDLPLAIFIDYLSLLFPWGRHYCIGATQARRASPILTVAARRRGRRGIVTAAANSACSKSEISTTMRTCH